MSPKPAAGACKAESASDKDQPLIIAEMRTGIPQLSVSEAVMRLDKAALDQWWDALGLRDASWWRKWKGPYPVDVK